MRSRYFLLTGLLFSSIILAGCKAKPNDEQVKSINTEQAPSSQTAQIPPEKADKVVEFNGSIFLPNVATIKKGQSIAFVNKSNQQMWPASNPHPTHDIYPEFDPQEPIDTGKFWSFTFDRVGTWKYHNHLDPGVTGTIIVTN